MNSKRWTRIIALAVFVALAIPVSLAAQDKQDHHHKHHHYKLVDIGTFGGPASYINNAAALGAPNQINNRGAVVGSAGSLARMSSGACAVSSPASCGACGGGGACTLGNSMPQNPGAGSLNSTST